jgi:uncharacterized membrane protein
MDHDRNPRSTARIAGHPVHPMLVPFPIASFAGALAADIVYASAREPFWATASQWLLGVGVVTALVAALAGFTDFLGEPHIRALREAWQHMLGNLSLVAVELLNLYWRLGNSTEAVVPVGLMLSVLGVLLMLFTGWKGWEMVYRYRVGISAAAQDADTQREQTVRHA